MKQDKVSAETLQKAITAGSVHTANYNSGVQVRGVFTEVLEDAEGGVAYIRTAGPTSLAYRDTKITGHGTSYHREGFGSPVGCLQGFSRCISEFTAEALQACSITEGQRVSLEYTSGITVYGDLQQIYRRDNRNLILTFTDCTVKTASGKKLFDPAWGNYDLAVGSAINSVQMD
jgi:phenylalanine-4-hydroxylase